MKIHITNLYGQSYNSVAQKAQHMVTEIARGLKYNELGIYRYNVDSDSPGMLCARLDGIIASVCFGDIVIVQLPTWNDIKFEEALIGRLNNYRGLKKIFFIHDVPPLMFENGLGTLNRYIALYNQADLIIAPSQGMIDFLRSEGLSVRKTVIQRIWDLPVVIDQSVKPQFRKRINFAANVTSNDRPFVKNWNCDTVELAVTANRRDCGWATGKNIDFLGWFSNDYLLVNALRRSGGFGLLWQDCPWWHEYMKINASYKLGTYLAAGLPVIVSGTIAESETIRHKNLGIVVDSVEEAVERVNEMKEEQYKKMADDAGLFSDLIREGYFTKKILIDAVFKLLYD